MDTVKAHRSSLWTRALRWLRNYETAMEMQPVDYLEMRVAELERRAEQAAPTGVPNEARPARAFEAA